MSSGKRGLKRLAELEKERARIKEKLEIAEDYGVPEHKLRPLVEKLELIDKLIGTAAREEAKRELRCLAEEARRVRDGKKKPGGNHPGNKHDEPDDDDDDDDDNDQNGNGGGNGDNNGSGNGDGNGHDGGGGGGKKQCCCCCCCAKPKSDKKPASGSSVPDATCVYVQGPTSVAAWSRARQDWVVFRAGSPIVKVVLITGGILAVAERGAAIFDCKLGIWLKTYRPSDVPLSDGGGR